MDTTIGKRAAGQAAARLVQTGMLVGLGTGSTAHWFIEALGKRCQAGLNITAVATSKASSLVAARVGIPLLSDETITHLDLVVDGADEIDPLKCMIKGGGGALLREKIVAQSAQEMIVIVDQTKLVHHLGRCPVPLELLPFAWGTTLQRLRQGGYHPMLRMTSHQAPYVTDNGNFIADLHLEQPILSPKEVDQQLKAISGVLETGLFYNVAGRVIVGLPSGEVTFLGG